MRTQLIQSGLVLMTFSFLVLPLSACAEGGLQYGMKVPTQTSAPLSADQPVELESPVLTESGLTTALDMGYVANVKFFDTPGMRAFYESRNFKPVWIQNIFYKNKNIQPILIAFEQSWEHGLNPNKYNVEKIRGLMETAKGGERYQLDLIISDALVRYGRDMSAMRVDPKRIGQRSQYWRKPLRAIDTLDYVSSHPDMAEALDSLAPKGKLYTTLQSELKRLYKMPAKGENGAQVNITRALSPGTTDKAVLSVRQRMGFDAQANQDANYFYDDDLAAAVMAFQKSHGLKQDGIVGKQTVALMNISREKQLKQVLANLERLRWVEQNKPRKYIMVNVPSAMLWAVQDGDVKIEMPVVVGRQERATNIFTTQVDGIRFNPTWTVPPTIKKDDYLPKLRKNPYYLSDRGIEIMKGSKTVDPGLIDWKNKTWSEVNAMRMVQGSGVNNPLGRIRFLMNNPFNIYLHDTPNKKYFSRADRALSSGCVRLERPIELADFVLEDNKVWSAEKRDAILGTGKLREVYAENKMPVYILYQTVWLGANNQIVYGADIYGHDDTLIEALTEINGIAEPVQGNATQTALNIK